MTNQSTKPSQNEAALLRELARDMSVCTADELRARWDAPAQTAIAQITGQPFDILLKDHNPIYYLAERVFFDNVLDNPKYLYAPLHRDGLSAFLLHYALRQTPSDRGALVIIQRESFKSTFMHGVVPLFLALRAWHLRREVINIGLIHQKELQASANLVRLKKKLMNHPWLRRIWPEACTNKELGTKTEFSWPFVPDTGIRPEENVIARGITADLTGFHFDEIFFSDLVVKEHRTSRTLRERTKQYYDAMIYTLTSGTGRKWHDGTPYHPRDLWGRMIDANTDGKKIYATFIRGAIYEETDENGKVTKKLSHPFRHSNAVLDAMLNEEIARSGNGDLFDMQMLCKNKTLRQAATRPEWLKYCPMRDVNPRAWRVITVDPAWKGSKNSGEGDFAVIEVWFLERRGSLVLKFLVDGCYSNELTDADGKSEIFRLMKKHSVSNVATEEIGSHAFRTSLRNEAITRGVWINVIDLKSQQQSKDSRIVPLLGEMQAGRVFIVDECDSALKEAFVGEYLDYAGPETLDHDDALDAAAYTCDPAIADEYTPRWDYNKMRAAAPPLPMDRKTRHCAR